MKNANVSLTPFICVCFIAENPSPVLREEKRDRGKIKKNLVTVREKDGGKRKIKRERITKENCSSFVKKE